MCAIVVAFYNIPSSNFEGTATFYISCVSCQKDELEASGMFLCKNCVELSWLGHLLGWWVDVGGDPTLIAENLAAIAIEDNQNLHAGDHWQELE